MKIVIEKFSKIYVELENILEKLSKESTSRLNLMLILLVGLTFILRVITARFETILLEDVYFYVLKASEILNGNFSPMLLQEDGLSFAIAAAGGILGIHSIPGLIMVSQWLSIIFESVALIPVALCAKEIGGKRVALVAAILYASWIPRDTFGLAQTESLAVLLISLVVWSAIKSRVDWRYMFISSACAGYMAITRENGWPLLIAEYAIFLFTRQARISREQIKPILKQCIFSVIPFFLIWIPDLINRAIYFGNPFSFGYNSNFWVDSYAEMIAPNLAQPSFLDFLGTHGITSLFERFIIGGAGMLSYVFFLDEIPAVLLVLFFAGVLNKKIRPLIIALIIFIAPLIAIWQILIQPRFITITTPIVLIVCAETFIKIVKRVFNKSSINRNEKKHVITMLVLTIIVSFMLINTARTTLSSKSGSYRAQEDSSVLPYYTWGQWCADNIRNATIMIVDSSAIMAHFQDARVGGLNGITSYAPYENIKTISRGYFDSTIEAYTWIKTHHVTHVVLDLVSALPQEWERDLINDTSQFKLLFFNQTNCYVFQVL